METINTQTPDQKPTTEQAKEFSKSWKKPAWWLVVILALGGGLGLWQIFKSEPPVAQTTAQEPPPRPVETISLTQGTGVRRIKLLGQAEASERATLRSQIDGTVKQVLVKEGDRVTPGKTVAILDDADQRLALSQAQARLAEERSNLERVQVGTRPEIIRQREAEVRSAKTREQEARDNLKNITALQPDLLAQREAELQSAKVREKEAQDNLQRIKGLATEGALSERALVEARTTADATTSERLRAEAAVTGQKTESQQTIAQAKAAIDTAQNERLRLEALLAEAKAGPTKEEIAAQQGVVSSAQAFVNQAELELQRAQIKANLAGVVRSRTVSVGDYLEEGDPILTLVSGQAVDIFLELPEDLSGQVKEGMPVQLTARALANWQQQATITGVVPAANATSRRQLVRVSLPNPPADLLPGMAIQGDLELPVETANSGDTPTFVVPRDALTRRGNEWLVFTVNDGQVQQLNVEMVSDMGQEVAIANEQLQAGQSIVLRGGDGLKDGSSVKLVEPS